MSSNSSKKGKVIKAWAIAKLVFYLAVFAALVKYLFF